MSHRIFVVVVAAVVGIPLLSAVVQLIVPIPTPIVESGDSLPRASGGGPVKEQPGPEAPASHAESATDVPVDPNATVVKVIDGDTIVVRFPIATSAEGNGTTEIVRLLGIDTPETHKPATPVECYGPEAAIYTESLLPKGTRVRLSRDVETRDRFGRLLAYVERANDGLMVNAELVRVGVAAPLSISPNVTFSDVFYSFGQEAQAHKRGIWAVCGGPHAPAARS